MKPLLMRIKRDGHEVEGRMVIESGPVVDNLAAMNMRFEGHLICGPHDDKGNHVAPLFRGIADGPIDSQTIEGVS